MTCPTDWTGGSGKGYVEVTVGLSYKWGPNGHVVEAGINSSGTMQYETLHWDGNKVLFTTTSGGTADDLKVDGDADITLSGSSASANFTQRDFSGATGNPPNASRQLCATTTTPYIWQPGSDGITDGYNVFQGVRNYDPAVGTWSTPDAYQGEVSDPMSQHAYMWNRNNALEYSDPSGYDPEREEGEEEPPPEYLKNSPYFAAERQIFADAADKMLGKASASGDWRAIDETRASHMFNANEGHVIDSDLNRALIENTGNDAGASLGTDKFGNQWYAKSLSNGAQVWAEVRNGKIINGGINKSPRAFNSQTGLNAPQKPGPNGKQIH